MKPMDIAAFRQSLSGAEPPPGLSVAQRALWWDAKGDPAAAHTHAQEDDTPAGAWVHAYLHRKEGDLPNAHYWYGRAGQSPAEGSLETEWHTILGALLGG